MSKVKIQSPIFAGLDIGSTKVVAIIATLDKETGLNIAGIGTASNTGIRQGVVVNIDATTAAIMKAKEEAELMSGYPMRETWIGVSGNHIKSFNSRGMVAIKNKEVTKGDVDRVLEAARAVAVPADRILLHVLPRDFKIDGTDGIWDPVGMSGVRLESAIHLITGGHTTLQNALKCIEKAGLKTAGLVLDQLAASMAVLSEDERNLGVCVVDIGGGTSNLLYFVNGHVAHTSVIPIGGHHFTQDIAVGLRTPQISAEDLKKKYGCAVVSLVDEAETIEVEGVGGRRTRTVRRRELAEVIEPRAEEILQMIYQDIKESGMLPFIGAGVVLTGGTSEMDGLVEMGEFIFDIPVRRGIPGKVGGLTDIVRSPMYATAVGLVLYGYDQNKARMLGLKNDDLGESIAQAARQIKGFFGKLF
jgi:cell division protein FtsA